MRKLAYDFVLFSVGAKIGFSLVLYWALASKGMLASPSMLMESIQSAGYLETIGFVLAKAASLFVALLFFRRAWRTFRLGDRVPESFRGFTQYFTFFSIGAIALYVISVIPALISGALTISLVVGWLINHTLSARGVVYADSGISMKFMILMGFSAVSVPFVVLAAFFIVGDGFGMAKNPSLSAQISVAMVTIAFCLNELVSIRLKA